MSIFSCLVIITKKSIRGYWEIAHLPYLALNACQEGGNALFFYFE